MGTQQNFLSSFFRNTEQLVLRQQADPYEVLYLLLILFSGCEPKSERDFVC